MTSRSDLPIPDYDHLPEGSLTHAGRASVQAGGETDNNQPLRHGVAGQTPNRNIRAR